MKQAFIRAPIDTLHRLVRDRRGTTAVEFALVAPALCLLIYGVMEFGRLAWTQSALNFAVEEAARCASVTPTVCGTSSQIATYAASEIATGYVPASAFSGATASCGHQVSATFAYPFIATGLFSMTPTLTATACFP
ncbi:MAG: TadE family protein [Caulobacteraceae bacterium]|jgi:Flp pilus assembly protein TadG|nr:TadE family protein [Caulobacteraceae bacterium]